MPLAMKYTVVHAPGRVSFRRVYPVDLRPFIPAQPQELKVSLGRQGGVGLGTRHDAAMRQYDAIVAKARAKQSGHLNVLTPADVTYLADRFVVDRLQEDEEGRWDQEGRDLYIAVTEQLQAAGVAFASLTTSSDEQRNAFAAKCRQWPAARHRQGLNVPSALHAFSSTPRLTTARTDRSATPRPLGRRDRS